VRVNTTTIALDAQNLSQAIAAVHNLLLKEGILISPERAKLP
jgi:hypothetical protein